MSLSKLMIKDWSIKDVVSGVLLLLNLSSQLTRGDRRDLRLWCPAAVSWEYSNLMSSWKLGVFHVLDRLLTKSCKNDSCTTSMSMLKTSA